MTATFVLPIPPSSNGLFAGKLRRYRSAEYEAWITEAGYILNRQRVAPFRGRVSIGLEIEEPKTKRRTDLDNRTKAVLDLLVSHGIIEGDDQRYVRKITLQWSPIVTGVRITIASLSPLL